MTQSISPPRRGGAGVPTQPGGLLDGLHARFRYVDGVYELELPAADGAGRRGRCLAQGATEFALVEEGPLLLLAYRIGDLIPWSAALYEPSHARGRAERWESGPIEPRALLVIGTADAPASRNVTLSMDFTRCLREALREQERMPYDPVEHRRALNGLCRRFTSPRVLVTQATARCMGSD